MPNSKSFWNHPIEQLQEALDLRKQIVALEKRMTSLLGGTSQVISTKTTGRKKISAAARARMAAGQKARWVKIRGGSAVEPSKPTTGKTRKKGGLTLQGRARLAAAMKERWAAKKKEATAPNASANRSPGNTTTTKGNRTTTVYR